MFFNRATELAEFERLWEADKAGLVVLYGRRRVGKSALLGHFARERPSFSWTATRTTSKRLLEGFSRELQLFKNPKAAVPAGFSYPTWEAALLDLAELCRKQRILVIFDEFPYVVEANGELPSLLQKMWDDLLSKGRALFCISGSRIGMIEKQILSSRGPLYGRASAVMWLDPLAPPVLGEFLPNYSPSQLLEVYAITGGVPLYVEMFDDDLSVLGNVKRELGSLSSIFTTESHFLIHEELKEPMRYVAILESIGAGKRTQAEIAAAVGIDRTHVMPYLQTLEGLRFIKRLVPVTERPRASRKGIYVIRDLFLKFHFRFIAPRMSLLEAGLSAKVLEEISSQFDAYVGKDAFEEFCRRWLVREAEGGRLPFAPDAIGRYWDAEVEADLAAISHKHRSLILGEAKWSHRKCSLAVLQALSEKADHLAKKFGFHVIKMLFSKSGFDDKLAERARVEQVRLVRFEEMWKEMKRAEKP